jgi:hypothetical protein
MNELSLEEQKILTEWLGECWHEYTKEWNSGIYCKHCNYHRDSPRLDFSDWRVIGRLIEKAKILTDSLYESEDGSGVRADQLVENINWALWDWSISTPQLAICKVILAYLKEGEGELQQISNSRRN